MHDRIDDSGTCIRSHNARCEALGQAEFFEHLLNVQAARRPVEHDRGCGFECLGKGGHRTDFRHRRARAYEDGGLDAADAKLAVARDAPRAHKLSMEL